MKDGVVSLVGSKDIVHDEFPYIVIEYFKDGIHRPSDAELNIEGQAVVAEQIQQFYQSHHTITGTLSWRQMTTDSLQSVGCLSKLLL